MQFEILTFITQMAENFFNFLPGNCLRSSYRLYAYTVRSETLSVMGEYGTLHSVYLYEKLIQRKQLINKSI